MAPVSAKAIVRRDYIVCLLLLAPLLFWCAAAAALLFMEMSAGYVLAAALFTLITPPLAFWRYRSVRHILENGTLLSGEVRRNLLQGGRGRLEFSYSVNGKDYVGVQPFMRVPEAERLNPGTTVRVRVDPKAPHHALLPALFEEL
jgi:hypothetical protein